MEVGGINTSVNQVASSSTIGAKEERRSEPNKQASSAQEIANRAEKEGEAAQINREQFSELVSHLNDSANVLRMQLRFGYSEDIGGLYLSVLDAKSGDVVRQIPSEQAIKFIARMREVAGLLLDERV
jgi:flagellar protein FlaG